MHTSEKRAEGWGDVGTFRRERAQRVARARARTATAGARALREAALHEDHPVVVSLAAYRSQLATGEARRLDYAGALIEWLRLGEGLSPESLEVAVTFMMGWPAHIKRRVGQILPFRQG